MIKKKAWEVAVLPDGSMKAYYFVTLLFLLLPPIFYLFFRFSVESRLRGRRISKTRIRKLKKGKRNFWWYEALHKEFNLGWLYSLNKIFTVGYLITLILSVTLGWCRFMAPVITVLYALVSLAVGVMSLFSSAQGNVENYGTPIVLLRRTRNRGFTSSVLDLMIAGFPLWVSYAHILGTIEVMQGGLK